MPPPPTHKLFLLKEGRGRIIAHLLNITLVPQCSRCCIHPSASAAAAFVNCRRNDSRKSFYPHHTPHPTSHHVPPFSFPLYPAPFFFWTLFLFKSKTFDAFVTGARIQMQKKKREKKKTLALFVFISLFLSFLLFLF